MAVVEATQGPIDAVTHTRYQMTDEAARADRMRAMHQVLGELEPVLAQPVYDGDIETALIHHMGRAAFGHGGYGSDAVNNYRRFAGAIDKDTAEGPTPVLLVSQIRSGHGTHGNTETALVMVDPEKTSFRSSVVHERDLHERGHAHKIAITRRSIALVGVTSTIHADISGYGGDHVLGIHDGADLHEGQDELVLSQRSVIDGKNGRGPITVEHDGFRRDIDRMGIISTPKYIVGWDRISGALVEKVNDIARGHHEQHQKGQDVFPYVLNLRGFLERTGQLEVLLGHSAPLKKIFKHADALEESISDLTPPQDYDYQD